MADADVAEKDSIRSWIRTQIQRVPASVINGSYQASVDFKKFHADVTKAISSDRTTVEKLRGLRVQVINLYQGGQS